MAHPTTTADTTTTERAEVLEALEPWPDLREIMERRLAGYTCQEAGLAMGITRLAAERLWERALGMAQHLMAADHQHGGGQVELLVTEIEIEQQLLLFPLAA